MRIYPNIDSFHKDQVAPCFPRILSIFNGHNFYWRKKISSIFDGWYWWLWTAGFKSIKNRYFNWITIGPFDCLKAYCISPPNNTLSSYLDIIFSLNSTKLSKKASSMSLALNIRMKSNIFWKSNTLRAACHFTMRLRTYNSNRFSEARYL